MPETERVRQRDTEIEVGKARLALYRDRQRQSASNAWPERDRQPALPSLTRERVRERDREIEVGKARMAL